MAKQEREEDGDAPEQESPANQETPANREGESAMMDAREAAKLCSFSESMLYKLNRAGKMPPPIRIGALLRWKRSDVVRWIEEGCPEDRPEG